MSRHGRLYQNRLAHPPRFARVVAIPFLVLCWLGAATDISSAGANAWTGIGPVGAHVTSLAIDPTTPSTLYVGTDGGGVFKSTNGGGSWNPANAGLTITGVFALAVDPQTPSTLYAGGPGGVFKSTDGADGWSTVISVDSTGFPVWSVLALAVDPQSPSTLYAATVIAFYDPAGALPMSVVYKSTDGGGSWDIIWFEDTYFISALAVDPRTSATLLAGGYGGVFKTTDGGSRWSAVSPDVGRANIGVVWALAADPQSGTTLYLGTEIYPWDSTTTHSAVFQSTDAAGSWHVTSTQSIHAFAIDPRTPTTVYAGVPDGVLKSTDGGGSWSPLSTGVTSPVSALVVDPLTPTTVYAVTLGGGAFVIAVAEGVLH